MKKLTIKELEKSESVYFDKLANNYDKNYNYINEFTKYKIDKKSKEFKELIIKSLGFNKNKRQQKFLELGCGTGEYTKNVAKLLPQVKIIGLDISKNIVDVARKKCKNFKNVSFVVESAYKTRFPDESFDVIFGYYVLHHLRISKLVKEIHRLLKPGGSIYFYEPNILNPAVYLIKSNKYLKKKAGDSPNEWAINPLTIRKYFKNFSVFEIKTSEFILPANFLPANWLKILDKITALISYIPIFRLFGGSVRIYAEKPLKTKIN